MGELSKRLNAEAKTIADSPVNAATLAALIVRISDGTISHNAAKQVFDLLWAGGVFSEAALPSACVDRAIENLGVKQLNDTAALEIIVDEVVAAHPKSVDEYRAGKEKAFNALVGQMMKASQGKANPAQANELLKKRLG